MRNKKGIGITLLILIAAVIAILIIILLFKKSSAGSAYKDDADIKMSYEGDSGGLKKSNVVAAMDTPASGAKNAIWCGSFSLAWKKLVADAVKEPIRLANGNDAAERMNREPFGATDLAEESYYAAAGLVKNGIVDKILQDMAERFPATRPSLQVGPDDQIIAYAYLEASVKFKIPFPPGKKNIKFMNSDETITEVSAFGISKSELGHQTALLVNVLYQIGQGPTEPGQKTEYALDLSEDTRPYQIILASAPFQGSLRATANYVESKIREKSSNKSIQEFGNQDVLLAPEMAWRVSHHFKELEGEDKKILNPGFEGLHIGAAMQDIEFILNRYGAKLKSESNIAIKGITDEDSSPPRYFVFDHPFLLLIRMRGKTEPVLAMWVANSELLRKW